MTMAKAPFGLIRYVASSIRGPSPIEIARDTVEEKVLELQRAKRDLADAIITEDNSVVARIDREDLEFLLS
jgi:hypothetical protein